MSKEKMIYDNMKKRGIKKCYGKWIITYPKLYYAIEDSGYEKEDTIHKIIDGMINKGYIRRSVNVNGKNKVGIYVIEKWVNN